MAAKLKVMENLGIPLGRNVTVQFKKADDTRIQSAEKRAFQVTK